MYLVLPALVLVLSLWRLGANYHLVKYVPYFLPGVLAYSLRDARRTLPAWVLFAFIGAFAIALPVAVARGARENVAAWPICLALGLLIPHCREVLAPWARQAGKTIAKYSYGIYLVHLPCIELAFGRAHGLPAIAQWAASISATGALTLRIG